MLADAKPLASVLICTLNRRENVVPTVQSIRRSGYEQFEVLVLDQSADDSTEQALRDILQQDARVRYIRRAVPGKPGALNHGFREARGDYVLLTDDDCEVLPGWIAALLDGFGGPQQVGCVFGDVAPGAFDRALGYIPDCPILAPRVLRSPYEFVTMPGVGHYGIGANMAVRRELLQELRGWDECIGPGTKFGSGDDVDLAVRALRAGYAVKLTPEARVVHYGFRYWKSRKRDSERSGFGVGAIFAKHLRCGSVYGGALRAFGHASLRCGQRLLRGERPVGATYPVAFVRGLAAGITHKGVDRDHCAFLSDEPEGARYADRVADVVLRESTRPQG